MSEMTAQSTTQRASGRILAAVALLSGSGLMFELTLTRIFSATIWYHYAFVAISVALLGWGLGGLLVYMLRLSRWREQAQTILAAFSLVLSLTLPLFLYTILQFPFTPDRLNFYFAMGLLPFLAGGATLSLMFDAYGSDSNRLYFADLLGAAAGTIIVPMTIGWLGAETAVLATAILPAAAAVLLSLGAKSAAGRLWTPVACIAFVALLALAAYNHKSQYLTIRNAPEKALYKLKNEHPESYISSDRWNSYSRITCLQNFDNYHLARLFIDSDAETSVLRWNGSTSQPANAKEWFRAFPFRLKENPHVMVIGPGGGTDVVMALAAGSPKVTAVEMNPLIIDCVNMLGAEAGNLYSHKQVELVMSEGRNFVERTDKKFDMIVLGFVDSWASVAGGGLSLTENYLYTRNALEAYYNCLAEGGTLVIIRWPMDVPRLIANSVDFLSERGMPIEEIGKHVLAASVKKVEGDEPVETVFMLTKSPMSKETVDRLLAGHTNAHVEWAPFRPSDEPYASLFAGKMDFAKYTDYFPTLATPVHDDRPFYFATEKPNGIPSFMVYLFKLPLFAVIGFTILLLLATKGLGFQAPGPRTVAYFGALGVGFIVCEVALMQRLILLLGHPIYSLVVILFTLLLAGGLGSLYARRFSPQQIRGALAWILPLVVVMIVVAAFLLPLVVHKAMPLSREARIAIAALITFPFGFFMGMPFPLGLRRHSQDPAGAPASVLWGINGVASVVGSVGGVALAVLGGFTSMFLLAAACYAVALLVRPK